MSLVGDALRRARQDAARKEAERQGLAVPPSLAPGIRRPGGGRRAALAALLALAAAGGGAGLTWILTRVTAGEGTEAAAPASSPLTAPDEKSDASSGSDPRADPVGGAASTAPAADPALRRDQSPAADHLATGEIPAQEGGTDEPARPPSTGAAAGEGSPAASRAPAAERVFVVDAELGYATLHLDYLVYKPSSPFARINGRSVIIGSVIEGFTVEEIGPEFVRLSDHRGPVVLRTK